MNSPNTQYTKTCTFPGQFFFLRCSWTIQAAQWHARQWLGKRWETKQCQLPLEPDIIVYFPGQWLKTRSDKGSLLPSLPCGVYIQSLCRESSISSPILPPPWRVLWFRQLVLCVPTSLIFQATSGKGTKTGFQRNFMLLLFEQQLIRIEKLKVRTGAKN